MDQPKPQPSPLRVLLRPPPPTAPFSSTTTATTSSPLPNPSSLPHAPLASKPAPSPTIAPSISTLTTAPRPDGVVVVGFVGSRASIDTTHLINRILDAHVFGSGGLDKDIYPAREEDSWFRDRRISYYHDEEKGMVLLQFFSSASPSLLAKSSSTMGGGENGFDSVLEEYETGDLRGMLFMFLVCHIVIFVNECLRFDTKILKKFRVLQAAKHALAPFLRSRVMPIFMPNASSSLTQPAAPKASFASPSSRRGGIASRRGSALSLMSGPGSLSSVIPGLCTPVILFVFNGDLSEILSATGGSNVDDSVDVASLSQPSSAGGVPRPSGALKGSGSVVMLARPMSKPEGGFRKKLHLSLETQIRFLIKKCRTLAGADSSHPGSRGTGSGSYLPLFSMDLSRIATLLDRSVNQRGEVLDFVTSIIEDALNTKASDLLTLDSHCQNLNNEDIQSLKDFIYRQSDTLRGRGSLPSNANTSSVAGVGMVAVAAAAAAASASAGKTVPAPELPSLEKWLSSSSLILDALVSVKHVNADDIGNVKNLLNQRNAVEIQDEMGTDAVDVAVSCLESTKGLRLKFSRSWCERALPAAKEVYLKDLPACYPTVLHKTQLVKAIRAFQSMVKGPAVQFFARKLEDECTSIWESGRQLCDALSLTGKPCMHQRHDLKDTDLSKKTVVKQHSSGYVFLHSCACGRSRRIRDDPFDFKSANVKFNCFPNCEDLLPTLLLPELSNEGRPLPHNSWRLTRVGGANYYKPLRGLHQIGFCSRENFLLRWVISVENQKETSNLPDSIGDKGSVASSTSDLKFGSLVHGENGDIKISDAAHFPKQGQNGESGKLNRSSEVVSSPDTSIKFGSFNMKKPFSEVVAGTAAVESTFILQHKKQPRANSEKGMKQVGAFDKSDVHLANGHQASERNEQTSVHEGSSKLNIDSHIDVNPVLQIGSNIVPVNVHAGGNSKLINSSKQAVLYVGFEHECSYGHRFLLSPEHLKELESSYSLPEKSPSAAEDSDKKWVEAKDKTPEKNLPPSGMSKSMAQNIRRRNRPSVSAADSQLQIKSTPASNSVELQGYLPHCILDGGPAFSLLNKNLPVYMNCPHCRNSKMNENPKIKFASTVSQLQRIFVVTPPFPTVLATCPVVQFEDSCLPPSVANREQQSRFSLGCDVILPPESFLTLRLPFIYGVELADGTLHPLNHLEHQPERTACLNKGSTLQVVSRDHLSDELPIH